MPSFHIQIKTDCFYICEVKHNVNDPEGKTYAYLTLLNASQCPAECVHKSFAELVNYAHHQLVDSLHTSNNSKME